MQYPMDGLHPTAHEYVKQSDDYKEADCIELDGRYRVDRTLTNEYRTYMLDDFGIWQRTRKFPFLDKDSAVDEILNLRKLNNGG